MNSLAHKLLEIQRVCEGTADDVNAAFKGAASGISDMMLRRVASMMIQCRWSEAESVLRSRVTPQGFTEIMKWAKSTFTAPSKANSSQIENSKEFQDWYNTKFLPFVKYYLKP